MWIWIHLLPSLQYSHFSETNLVEMKGTLSKKVDAGTLLPLASLFPTYLFPLLPTYLWTLLSTHRLPLASLACLWCKCPRPLCGPTLPTTQASAAALQDLRPPSPQLVSSKDLAGMVYIKRLRALLLSTCCTISIHGLQTCSGSVEKVDEACQLRLEVAAMSIFLCWVINNVINYV